MSTLKNIESWIERTLTTVIDFFYPPFRKVMSLELFRYAACGGLNLVLEWVLYYVFRFEPCFGMGAVLCFLPFRLPQAGFRPRFHCLHATYRGLRVQVSHHFPDGFLDGETHQFLGVYFAGQDTDRQIFPRHRGQHSHQLLRPEALRRGVPMVADHFLRHHLRHLRDVQLSDEQVLFV